VGFQPAPIHSNKKVSEDRMKTFAALALVGLLLTGTVGCGAKDDGAGSNAGGTTNSSASPSDNAKVPDTTTIDGKTVPLKKTASGLRYYDTKVGTGPSPQNGQTVSVQYTGTLLDSTKFDSTADHGGQPFEFRVGAGDVIKGWDEGVLPMKVGGKRRLVIPGDLAYGDGPPGPPITPNATLVFDIELVAVK